jgi:hypothetical protein
MSQVTVVGSGYSQTGEPKMKRPTWPGGRVGLEREKRFELSTLSLATRCSTTELFPLLGAFIPHTGPGLDRPGP